MTSYNLSTFTPPGTYGFNSVFMVDNYAIAGSSTDSGLWYSSDYGQTWMQSTPILTINFNSVFMVGTTAIASSSTGGLWYSINSGVNWTQSTNTSGGLISGSFNSVCMSNAYAIAGSSGQGLWYSSTSGQSWTQSTYGSSNSFVSVFILNSYAIAGSSGVGLWSSIDYGVTWTTPIQNNNYSALYMVGNNAIASGSFSLGSLGLLYSANNGINWNVSFNRGYFSSTCMSNIQNADGTYNAIAGAVGAADGILYSVNSGQSLTKSANTTGFFNSVYMVGANAIAASSSGTGLWYSVNSGKNWTQSTTTSGTFESVFINSSLRSIVAANQGIYYSSPSSLVCFKEDAKILTNNGYKLIQDLIKGDLVKTVNHGYKAINMMGK